MDHFQQDQDGKRSLPPLSHLISDSQQKLSGTQAQPSVQSQYQQLHQSPQQQHLQQQQQQQQHQQQQQQQQQQQHQQQQQQQQQQQFNQSVTNSNFNLTDKYDNLPSLQNINTNQHLNLMNSNYNNQYFMNLSLPNNIQSQSANSISRNVSPIPLSINSSIPTIRVPSVPLVDEMNINNNTNMTLHNHGNHSPNEAIKQNKCTCKQHDTNRIPRPRNAFILFRQKNHQALLEESNLIRTNPEVSRELGRRWRNLSDDDRNYWNQLAEEEKKRHAEKYPGYKYTPKRNNKKKCDYCNHKLALKALQNEKLAQKKALKQQKRIEQEFQQQQQQNQQTIQQNQQQQDFNGQPYNYNPNHQLYHDMNLSNFQRFPQQLRQQTATPNSQQSSNNLYYQHPGVMNLPQVSLLPNQQQNQQSQQNQQNQQNQQGQSQQQLQLSSSSSYYDQQPSTLYSSTNTSASLSKNSPLVNQSNEPPSSYMSLLNQMGAQQRYQQSNSRQESLLQQPEPKLPSQSQSLPQQSNSSNQSTIYSSADSSNQMFMSLDPQQLYAAMNSRLGTGTPVSSNSIKQSPPSSSTNKQSPALSNQQLHQSQKTDQQPYNYETTSSAQYQVPLPSINNLSLPPLNMSQKKEQ